MKNILIVLVSFSFVSTGFCTNANAATKTKKVVTESTHAPTHSAPKYTRTVETTTTTSLDPNIRFGGSLGLGIVDGNFGFGAGFRVDYPVKFDALTFRFGAETGVFRFTNSVSVLTVNYSSTSWVFPIAGTASYDLNLENTNFTLYGRASLGLDIVASKSDGPTVAGISTSASDTSIKFHFVVEPGIEFSNNQFFAALPFGAFAGGFLLMPTFGLHF